MSPAVNKSPPTPAEPPSISITTSVNPAFVWAFTVPKPDGSIHYANKVLEESCRYFGTKRIHTIPVGPVDKNNREPDSETLVFWLNKGIREAYIEHGADVMFLGTNPFADDILEWADELPKGRVFSTGTVYEEIIKMPFEKLTKDNPTRNDYAEDLIVCYQQLERYDDAEKLLDEEQLKVIKTLSIDLADSITKFIQDQTFNITEMKAILEVEELKTQTFLQADIQPTVQYVTPSGAPSPLIAATKGVKIPALNLNKGGGTSTTPSQGGLLVSKGHAYIGRNPVSSNETNEGNTKVKLIDIKILLRSCQPKQ